MLAVVAHFTYECVTFVVDQALSGKHVAQTMTGLAISRGSPGAIKVKIGSVFAGKLADLWAYRNSAELDFYRRGRQATHL